MENNLRGVEYLRNKLALKKPRVDLRYDFYEMKNVTRDLGISTPPDLRYFMSCIGWCAKAVDSLADRLHFRGFRNDAAGLWDIFQLNNPDIFFDSAVLSALISSCCFVYISEERPGEPRLQVIDGANATGVMDPITGMLREGYAVLSRDDNGVPTVEAYFAPGMTVIYENGKQAAVLPNKAPVPLLVPIVNRPDARREFGHSRISRACMNITGSALRTIKRSEISAEYYSFPQKWITGLSEDAEMDKWRASMSSLLTLTKDEDGDHPILGQFQAQSQTPHLEQLRMFAQMFAGETGLTMDDLGIPTDNPSSAEAIKASHETLRLMASKAQRTFGSGFLNVGYTAACLRDEQPYERSFFFATRPEWYPAFEPDAAAISLIGDGAIKLNQAVDGFLDEDTLGKITGLK